MLKRQENKEPRLKLVEGTKGPIDPNWLRLLPAGSVFSCRPKDYSGFQLETYEIDSHLERTTNLAFWNAVGLGSTLVVDSLRFSTLMECVELLAENKNNDNRPDQSG